MSGFDISIGLNTVILGMLHAARRLYPDHVWALVIAGGKILLNGAKLRLKRGRRYGLCGANGAGKVRVHISRTCQCPCLCCLSLGLHVMATVLWQGGDAMDCAEATVLER